MNKFFNRLVKGITFSFLIVLVGSSACVTQKKYNELLTQKVKLEGDLAERGDSLEQSSLELEHVGTQLSRLKSDTASLGQAYREGQSKYNKLSSEYKELDGYYNNLLNNSGKLSRDMEEQRDRLVAMRDDLEDTRKKNETLLADLQEREKKVQELEDILARKDEAVNKLKKNISNALLNFKESDLTVSVKNGKVYVSLAEQLLFNSGSIQVDPKGQAALKQLATAIKDQPDIGIMVEGHTDNVPIGRTSQYMSDNWDLSVMRATSIVRILINAGVTPSQVTAGGKGEFTPVSSNDDAAGRSKNRRTEIVISPNLNELFGILEGN